MTCKHLIELKCTHPESRVFGMRIATNICRGCPHYDGPIRGAGDVVAKVTKFMGIAPCSKCQKRRELMNSALPARGCGSCGKESRPLDGPADSDTV